MEACDSQNAVWGSGGETGALTGALPYERGSLERLHRLGLGDFMAALLAGAAGVVGPEIEHRLAKSLHDVGTIEIDVLDQRLAFLAIEDDVLVFPRRAAALHDEAERVGRADGSVYGIRRDEERFALAHEMIDDVLAFADAHFDVAF